MTFCDQFNLTCPCPQGDPDLAGVGVLIAFLFSTTTTAALSLLGLALLGTKKSSSFIDRAAHNIIELLRRQIRAHGQESTIADCLAQTRRNRRASRRGIYIGAIRNILLSLYDQSLFLGIALLMVQFIGLSASRISAMDFRLITDLVFLCSLTLLFSIDFLSPALTGTKSMVEWNYPLEDAHLAVSQVNDVGDANEAAADAEYDTSASPISRLRLYWISLGLAAEKLLQENSDATSPKQRHLLPLRRVRAYGLLLMFLMLVVSQTLGPGPNWYQNGGCPAVCLIKHNPSGGIIRNYPNLIFLSVAYATNIVRSWRGLHPLHAKFYILTIQLKREFRARLHRIYISKDPRIGNFFTSKSWKISYRTLLIIGITGIVFLAATSQNIAFNAILTLTSSAYVAFISFFLAYILNVAATVSERSLGFVMSNCPSRVKTENQWTNGQILPVALLVLPLLTLLQAFSEVQAKLEEERLNATMKEKSNAAETDVLPSITTHNEMLEESETSQIDSGDIALQRIDAPISPQPTTDEASQIVNSGLEFHEAKAIPNKIGEDLHRGTWRNDATSTAFVREGESLPVEESSLSASQPYGGVFTFGKRLGTWHDDP